MPTVSFLGPMRLFPSFLFSCSAVVSALLGGCAARETLVSAGLRTQTLHAALRGEPRDLDPHLATSPEEFTICLALLEGLTTLDPASAHARPAAASRWETSSDGLTWTFHLRPEARWSNGDPVTATDFVDGFRRVLTASLSAEYAPQLYIIRGAQSFHLGTLPDFSAVGARAKDTLTLEIRLENPVPYLATLTALPAWFPIHAATIEKFGARQHRGTAWTRPENFIGNGPFLLQAWQPNQHLKLIRATTYWDRANVHLQAACFYPVDNANTQEAMFRAGQLHLTTDNLPVEKVRAYRSDPRRAPFLQQGPLLATKFCRFNCTRGPLTDPRVRHALALALDREKLARNVMQSNLAAVAFTPPDCAGYTADRGVSTDIATARQLLANAGFPGGRNFPRLEILFYPSGSSGLPVAEAIQQMWREALGLDLAIVQQESKTVLDARRAMNYDILLSDWFGDYIDPLTFLEMWTRTSEHNKTGWFSPDYDQHLQTAARLLEPATRYATLRQAEALLLAAAPITPLFHPSSNELRHPAVRGWHANLVSTHPLQFVSLATE